MNNSIKEHFMKKLTSIIYALCLYCSISFGLLGAEEAGDCKFSGVAAKSTEWFIAKGSEKPILKPLTFMAARASSLALFPICSATDMIYYSTHFDKERFNKSAAGFFCSPASILSPDLVTYHFIPQSKKPHLIVPYGKLYSMEANVVYPETIYEVQCAVFEAISCKKSISVMGAGMSQGKQAIPSAKDNVIVNTSKLKRISIDCVNKVAVVESGATWGDLQQAANIHGLAVKVMQASNIFSIGGSLSANCHGWDYKTGCLRNTVRSVTIVNSNAELMQVDKEDVLFDYVLGGYGGFGVIVQAEIELADNVLLKQVGEEILPSDYFSYFKNNILENDAVDMHLYRLSLEPNQLFRTGVAVNYMHINEDPLVSNLKYEPVKGKRGDRVKLHVIRRLSGSRKLAWKMEKKNVLKGEVAARNDFMHPPINAVFNNSKNDSEWLQEYFVKGENLAGFLEFLADILKKNHVPLFNASVRYVKQDPLSKLSYAKECDRFAVVLFFNQKLMKSEIQKTKSWIQDVIDYLVANEGSFYLPYQHFATLEQFQACYPDWNEVLEMKLEVDPNLVFRSGFYDEYLLIDTKTSEEVKKSKFRQVFSRVDGQRKEMDAFLKNVFMQLDEKKFFALVDSILEDPKLSDEEIYEQLYDKISKAKPGTVGSLSSGLKALSAIKKDLSEQVCELVQPKPINGYVEIGYPGRLIKPLKKQLEINKPIYVVNEKESFSDHIEVGIVRPYDHFVALNDYLPISEKEIPTASVDLVSLYIGLHHIPEDRIEGFIASIKRVLRPGGSFILMDHDAYSRDLQVLVDVVHSIFNVATGVTPLENKNEIRNFQPMSYWISIVEANGFVYKTTVPLIREGDSTLNALVRFDKPEEVFEEAGDLIMESQYERALMKTYLTGPEWQNVRSAQSYADFVGKYPSYKYPYFKEIGGFWKVYGESWKAARQQSDLSDVALSEHNMMNLFVGTSMTLEYATKGILSAPLNILVGSETGEIKGDVNAAEAERIRSLKCYGTHIENIPFYKYPFFKDIRNYWKRYGESLSESKKDKGLIGSVLSPRNFKNLILGTGMTLEYTTKGLVSTPMNWVYSSEGIKEDLTIHLLVKDPDNLLDDLNQEIVIHERFEEEGTKHIEIPRYMRFKEILIGMSQNPSIQCINIAGQELIQVDIKAPKNSSTYELEHSFNAKQLYQIPMSTDQENIYWAYEVKVNNLTNFLREIERKKFEVVYIHDY